LVTSPLEESSTRRVFDLCPLLLIKERGNFIIEEDEASKYACREF